MSLVMVIDDMAVIREPIAASLRSHGYDTACAGDGMRALELIRSTPPDLILLDLSMPGMDGIAVLRALRSDPVTLKIPVILLTASADKGHVVEAAKLGVRDYILKTRFSLPELLTRVRKYVTSESPCDQAIPQSMGTFSTANDGRPPAAALDLAAENVTPGSMSTTKRLTREQTLERIAACTQTKTLPGVVAEVMALVSSPRGDVADLAGALKRDPILASRVLRLANSAAFASEKPRIATVEEAVRNVGMAGVRNLVLSVGVFESFAPEGKDGSSTLRCWQHSFAVASIMEKLAAANGTLAPGVAYLTGLCHELTEIVLHQHFAEELATVTELVKQTGSVRWQAEGTVFGLPYHDLVAVVLQQLGLPRAITEPIEEFFARPTRDEARSTESGLARALRLANIYAHGLMLAPSTDAPVTPFTTAEYRATIGITQVLKLNDRSIRDEVLMAVNAVAGLSPADAGRLCEPLIKNRNLKIGYFRHAEYSEFDPMATLLRFGGDVNIAIGLPDHTAPEQQYSAIVIAGSRDQTAIGVQQELRHIAGAFGPHAVPTLYLGRASAVPLEVPTWITVLSLPLSLGKAASFLQSLEPATARGTKFKAA